MNIQNMFSLKERVVVITGATSGIGRSIAVACAQSGARVAAIGRDLEKIETLKMELSKYGENHFFKSFDVTEYDKIPGLIDEIVEKCGKIGGFVHSAGICKIVPLAVMTPQSYDEIFAVNVIAGIEFIKKLTKKANCAPNTSIILISSVSASRPLSGVSAYSMSKGALLSGMKSLAIELSPKQIRVNAIVPGFISETGMDRYFSDAALPETYDTAAKRHLFGHGSPDSIACGAVYLLSPASEWITGTALVIDGGYSLG